MILVILAISSVFEDVREREWWLLPLSLAGAIIFVSFFVRAVRRFLARP